MVLSKFLTPQFHGFWDLVEVIYVESWADGLPDRFNFSGIANTYGYPPALGEIKIISWHGATNSASGQICMDQGDMTNDVFDWLFDDPQPSFLKQCWNMSADTLEPISSVILTSLPDTVALYENDNLSLAVHAFEMNNNPIVLFAFPLPNNASFIDSGNGKGVFKFHPDYEQGNPVYQLYPVAFTASNGSIVDTEIVIFKVLDLDRPPVLEHIATPKNIIEGQRLQFLVHASDPDSESAILTANNLPPNASFVDSGNATGLFDFTPDTTQGSPTGKPYFISFEAIDSTNNSLRDFQDVVINVFEDSIPFASAPYLFPIGHQTVVEGDTLILHIRASDPNSDPLLFSAAPLPNNALFQQTSDTTAQLIFTPDSNQAGNYDILFIVSDSTYADSELVVISVTEVNPHFFRVGISGPAVWNDSGTLKIMPNLDFNIDLYANNNDTIHPYLKRRFWTTPFLFTGDGTVSWGDTSLIGQSLFESFWDSQIMFTDSWDGILPDKFCFGGIATDTSFGYPPGLGEIKILSWPVKATSPTGHICIEKWDIDEESWCSWMMDPPDPGFETACWEIEGQYGPPPSGQCGRVTDTTGAPIEGAIVEFWINFPRDTLLFTDTTDPIGQFDCSIHTTEPFDVYAYKPGYYPGLLVDLYFPG